jgi:hypothetical protein
MPVNKAEKHEGRSAIEALAPDTSTLRQGKVLGDHIDAGRIGDHLATTQNFQNLDADGILAALGGAWVEADRDYPKVLGEALTRAGLDPDVTSLRSAAINAIVLFYDPLPLAVTSQTRKRH